MGNLHHCTQFFGEFTNKTGLWGFTGFIEGLSEGQTVVVDVAGGRKGPEAARVRLI
jgi:hypothetical protein